jgi:hypothetical protein
LHAALPLSLTGEQGVHTLLTSQRERKRVRERKKRDGEREREMKNMYFNCPELVFLKGMAGALAPFKYLVIQNALVIFRYPLSFN